MNYGSYCIRFFQANVLVAMGAFQLLPDGVSGEFNVFLAEEAGHFQVHIRPAKNHGCFAVRAGDFLAEVLTGKLDVSAAPRAGDFECFWVGLAARQRGPAGQPEGNC